MVYGGLALLDRNTRTFCSPIIDTHTIVIVVGITQLSVSVAN